MSRTYRHRHTVPKGYKAVNRDGEIVVIDQNGDVIWSDDHSGYYLRWQRFSPKYEWIPGYGFHSTMLERWKSAWFGKQKVPVVNHCIKDFDGHGRYRVSKEYSYFEKKATRRKVNMMVHEEEFDCLPLQEGRRPHPTQAYRRPRKKMRSRQENYLECVRTGETLSDQED